jgi:hypothetical protein
LLTTSISKSNRSMIRRSDPVPQRADPGGLGQDLHRLHRGPADQPGALLGDPAAVHVGVGLVVARGQPGPAGQLLRAGEAVHVTDLGGEHGSQRRADAGDGQDRGVSGVGGQPAA